MTGWEFVIYVIIMYGYLERRTVGFPPDLAEDPPQLWRPTTTLPLSAPTDTQNNGLYIVVVVFSDNTQITFFQLRD
jgi:hypothetical protein